MHDPRSMTDRVPGRDEDVITYAVEDNYVMSFGILLVA